MEWLDADRDNGLEVLFVMSGVERVEDVEEFVKAKKVPYPVLHDPQGANAKAWGAGGIATAFLLGRDGRVVWQGRIGPQGDAAGCRAAIRTEILERKV